MSKMCFWNTRWVFWRAIATMMRAERNRALAALRYVIIVWLSTKDAHSAVLS